MAPIFPLSPALSLAAPLWLAIALIVWSLA